MTIDHKHSAARATTATATTATATTATATAPATAVGRKAGIVISLAFGVFLLYGVGFATPNLLHNAAHDARHSVTFPCH